MDGVYQAGGDQGKHCFPAQGRSGNVQTFRPSFLLAESRREGEPRRDYQVLALNLLPCNVQMFGRAFRAKALK